MFDSGKDSSKDNKANGPQERRPSREIDPRNLPRGVYGVGVKQGSLEKSSSEDTAEDDDEVSTKHVANFILGLIDLFQNLNNSENPYEVADMRYFSKTLQ